MPRIPNQPRKGHPAKPRREPAEEDDAAKKPAHSYGQSAPMPERDADTAAREEFEDLTLEPIREEDEDEAKQGRE